MSPTRCVYTALFGEYEALNEQPVAGADGTRLVCFTDDADLTSDTWEVVVTSPVLAADPMRSVRHIKMLGHDAIAEHDEVLWIDNSAVLDVPAGELLGAWLARADLALALHSFRASVFDEFVAVLDDALDDPARVAEQLDHYVRAAPDTLDEQPLWGAIIARRPTPAVEAAMSLWWHHTLRYSRRDQLSVNVAIAMSNVDVNRVDVDNHASPWHHWPVVSGRALDKRHWDPTQRRRAPAIELALARKRLEQAQTDNERLTDQLKHLEAERVGLLESVALQQLELQSSREDTATKDLGIAISAQRIAALEADLERASAARDIASEQLASAVEERDRAHAQLASIGASRSWRALQRIQRIRVALFGADT